MPTSEDYNIAEHKRLDQRLTQVFDGIDGLRKLQSETSKDLALLVQTVAQLAREFSTHIEEGRDRRRRTDERSWALVVTTFTALLSGVSGLALWAWEKWGPK